MDISAQHLWSVHVGCIDDRGIQPIRAWAIEKFGVQHVDPVTEAGMDGFLTASMPDDEEAKKQREVELERIKKNLFVSLEHHKSYPVIVSGHYGCAGNPVSDDEHRQCIQHACELVRSWGVPENVEVLGVFVNSNWQVEEITPET